MYAQVNLDGEVICTSLRLDVGENFCTKRIIKHWNRLPWEVVKCPGRFHPPWKHLRTWLSAIETLDRIGFTLGFIDFKGIFQSKSLIKRETFECFLYQMIDSFFC